MKRRVYYPDLGNWPININSVEGFDTEEEAREHFNEFWKENAPE